MRLFQFIIITIASLVNCLHAKPIDYYFPADVEFNPAIPTPDKVLGYEVGQWHVRHDQLVQYLHVLAKASDRINIQTIGYSHEQRPLLLLTVSSAEKMANIEQIQSAHVNRLNMKNPDNSGPAVVWMGYSVHGNESSGSNAALLVAYYLAAATGPKIEQLLDNTVILLDPSLNPDGLARFAQWANMHKGSVLNPDPNHKEHNEAWPSARTNHYWFDLNRDWLLLQHPESKARIAQFHQWKPNILTDFHEMGPHSTFFFQPGIPSRKHPLTPVENVTLTENIAQFHAKALDEQKSLYFTQESFDDFYYGKGSTYPDINGSVGILFEQASSRGHQQDTINGLLTFPQTIKNQLVTSLSTFDAAIVNKTSLLNYQTSFYASALIEADNDSFNGYVVDGSEDRSRTHAFLSILKQHQINAYPLAKELKVDGQVYQAHTSYYIPFEQPQYRLIKAIFSEQKTFEDNTFYDVSGWTLAHAFNLPFSAIDTKRGLKTAEAAWYLKSSAPIELLPNKYAYAFEWNDFLAPKLLNALLAKDIKVRAALKPMIAKTSTGNKQLNAGAIVIPAGLQTANNWFEDLQRLASEVAIPVIGIESGLTSSGIDLGSRQLVPIQKPKVLLIGGKGTSQYEVGEVWYYLDKHVGLAPTIVDLNDLSRIDLSDYSHVILADGRYTGVTEPVKNTIRQWVKQGGVIWGHKGGAKYLAQNKLLQASYISSKDMADNFSHEGLAYGDKDSLAGQQRIAGAIFNTHIDLSHPLSFSLQRDTLPMFKNSTFLLEPMDVPFVNIATYQSAPLLAGFADDRNVTKIAGGLAVVAHNYGQGRVIAMTDNPVFRGYWYGTSRLLSNALFFGHAFSAKPE